MRYVIGDVHCQYWLLEKLLKKLNIAESTDEVYFVGDFVDRGLSKNESMKTLKFYVDRFNNNSSCYKTVVGNHDLDLVHSIDSYLMCSESELQAIKEHNLTVQDCICDIANVESSYESWDLLLRFREVCRKQPLYRELVCDNKKYIITHSWLVNTLGEQVINKPEEASLQESIWERKETFFPHVNDTTVIHGHTSTLSFELVSRNAEPGKVFIQQGNINVDCGACRSLTEEGNLAAYCIDTGEVIYALTDEERLTCVRRLCKWYCSAHEEETVRLSRKIPIHIQLMAEDTTDDEFCRTSTSDGYFKCIVGSYGKFEGNLNKLLNERKM